MKTSGTVPVDRSAGGEAWSALMGAAQGFLDEAERRRLAFLEKGAPEDLHRYRVSVRRARAALGVGRGIVDGRCLAACRRRLAAAMRSSNRLRDLDVKCGVLPLVAEGLPPGLSEGFSECLGVVQRERDLEEVKVRGVLRKVEAGELLQGLRPLRAAPAVDLGRVVRARVLKLVKRIAKLSAALTPDAQEERWHEVRIEGKKVRYLLEVFGDFFPKGRALKALAPLVRLQEALGDLNDNAMQRVFLRDSVWSRPLDGAGDELSRCLGGLEVLLEQRCKELRRAARRALERFRKSGARTVKGLG